MRAFLVMRIDKLFAQVAPHHVGALREEDEAVEIGPFDTAFATPSGMGFTYLACFFGTACRLDSNGHKQRRSHSSAFRLSLIHI